MFRRGDALAVFGTQHSERNLRLRLTNGRGSKQPGPVFRAGDGEKDVAVLLCGRKESVVLPKLPQRRTALCHHLQLLSVILL